MKILVLGASGYIGNPVAKALSRAGHTIYGQTRSGEKAKLLSVDEIIPVVCEPMDTNAYIELIPKIDTVIEALNGDLDKTSAMILGAISTASQMLRPPSAAKLAYIYTSGTWVHGDSRTDIVSDTTPIAKPAQLVSWRVDREQDVIKSDILNGIVIRVGTVYGRGGGILEPLFRNAVIEGVVAWYGSSGGHFPSIHQDDLADLYVRAAEKAAIAGGHIIDAANDNVESWNATLEKLAKVSGASGGYSWIEPSNLFEEALATTTLLQPYLGRALLDWHPRKPNLVSGMEIYYAAYKAVHNL